MWKNIKKDKNVPSFNKNVEIICKGTGAKQLLFEYACNIF